MIDEIGAENNNLYIQTLENRILKLEEDIKNIYISRPSFPDTALLDSNFLKRAFTVWGHYFVAQLLIGVPIYCILYGFIYLTL
jgi:hypothetical protein